ncbi:MAG: AMP-binding protein, partial [Giesbergeria sp.]
MPENATPLPLHEHLRRHARAIPDRAAYLWYGRAITWAELDAASDAFAARLQALGVQKGEPVALFMNNCPQYLMAHYGIQKIGAIVCPCGPLNKEHELQYQLDDLQARVIVAADVLLPVVEQVRARTALQHVFVVRYAELLPGGAPSIAVPAELLAMHAAMAPAPAGCEDFLAATRTGERPAAVELSMDDVALMT